VLTRGVGLEVKVLNRGDLRVDKRGRHCGKALGGERGCKGLSLVVVCARGKGEATSNTKNTT
jgi:hypothetical protein